MCKAFLRVPPHFSLWLKNFNVKPKVVDGQHGDCGGAMVRKLPKVNWPKGVFVDTIRIWQQEWFYIIEPCGPRWAAAPAFRSGPLLRLTSWTDKGPYWGSVNEVLLLQKRVQGMIAKDITLADVIQVMLIRRALPCQRRPLKMWEFNLEGPQTRQWFYGTTHKG